MKLSIITITYNNYEELVETCNSLKNISTEFEHVIINGGDCTRSKSFLSRYGENSSVLCVSEPDKGIYDAFNKGINYSSGDYISFLNSGDLLNDVSYHENAINSLERNNGDFIHAGILFDDEKYGEYKLRPKKGNNPGRGMLYMHPSMVVRAEVFKKIGTFNLDFQIAGDFDWACRLWKSSLKSMYTDRFPVKMNNRGISSKNEIVAIHECKRSLQNNELLHGKTKLYFYDRLIRFRIRRFLSKIDVLRLGRFYKRLLAS